VDTEVVGPGDHLTELHGVLRRPVTYGDFLREPNLSQILKIITITSRTMRCPEAGELLAGKCSLAVGEELSNLSLATGYTGGQHRRQ
jgi:hypothetical protein